MTHFIIKSSAQKQQVHVQEGKENTCVLLYFDKREIKLKTLQVEKNMYLSATKVIIMKFAWFYAPEVIQQ